MQSPSATAKAQALKRFGIAVLIIYWLLIFEGALRKWFLPMLSTPIFFLKDPFVIYIYYLAFKHSLWPEKNYWFQAFLVLLVITISFGFLQSIIGLVSPLTALYGLRMYFFCTPLCFLIAENFSRKQLLTLVKHSLGISVLMAGIVFLQYRSPPGAWINKTLEEDSRAFSYGSLARTSGTFSFTQGHELFCATLLPMMLACWMLPPQYRPFRFSRLVLCSVAVIVNILVNGNRALFLMGALTFLFLFIHRVVAPNFKFGIRQFMPEIILLVATLMYCTVFSEALSSMATRVQDTEGASSSVGRIGRLLSILTPLMKSGALLGYGLGSDIPAAQKLNFNFAVQHTANVEAEGQRIIDELGVVGLLIIGFRFAFAGYIFYSALQCSRREGFPLPLALASYSVLSISLGQISFNGHSLFYGWLFAGFTLAAARKRILPKMTSEGYRL